MNLVIISGKGGTGKTTIASSFVYLNEKGIALDCDVDAANLYLMLETNEVKKNSFSGAMIANFDKEKCTGCNRCVEVCKYRAISLEDGINELLCEGCGACTVVCNTGAMTLDDEDTGDIILEDIESGLFSRGELFPGAEGSGRMVTEVRRVVSEYVMQDELNIIDGSPGIGCQVIASIVGNDLALIITEPTLSGLNDLKRTKELLDMFGIKALVCINQYDINEEMSGEIKDYCDNNGLELVGMIPFDPMVKKAINEFKPVVTYDCPAARGIKEMFEQVKLLTI